MPRPPMPPATHDDVVLTPTQPKQAVAYEPPLPPAAYQEEPLPAGSFIPPQAERAVVRAARMPRVDELPVPAQNQIRASRGEPVPSHDQKRMTLLQRLATVGFGRREESRRTRTPRRILMPLRNRRCRRRARPPKRRASRRPVHAEYAKRPPPPQGYRPAQGQLDPQGRAPASRTMRGGSARDPGLSPPSCRGLSDPMGTCEALSDARPSALAGRRRAL